ncbi:MAG: hypothetical protein C0506_11960 [Anaerolinea sp.]|nr:hypothetical protein [Anaerolinea sp.]
MKVSDEQWIAEARARVATGAGWERDWTAIAGALHSPGVSADRPASGLHCPYCEARPGLETVRRYEVFSTEPLLRCPACYGFWAKGDVLATGVRDPYDDHPSFFAVAAAARCRSCHGHLREDESCVKCGAQLRLLNCPACGKQMERWKKGTLRLDSCAGCHGTWFDVGEIATVYGLTPPQSFPASLIDEHAADGEPEGWVVFLMTALRFLAPFI